MKRLRKFFAGLLALTTLVSTVPVNAYDADVPSTIDTGGNVVTTSDTPQDITFTYTVDYCAIFADGTPASGVELKDEITDTNGYINSTDIFEITYHNMIQDVDGTWVTHPDYYCTNPADLVSMRRNNIEETVYYDTVGFGSIGTLGSPVQFYAYGSPRGWGGRGVFSINLNAKYPLAITDKYSGSFGLKVKDNDIFTFYVNARQNLDNDCFNIEVKQNNQYSYTCIITVPDTTVSSTKSILPININYIDSSTGSTLYSKVVDFDFDLVFNDDVLNKSATKEGVDFEKFVITNYDITSDLQEYIKNNNVCTSYNLTLDDLTTSSLYIDWDSKLLNADMRSEVKSCFYDYLDGEKNFSIDIELNVLSSSCYSQYTVHYQDTDGKTIRDDKVYNLYYNKYSSEKIYFVEHVDGYTPTGVVTGDTLPTFNSISSSSKYVLSSLNTFSTSKLDNTCDEPWNDSAYFEIKYIPKLTSFTSYELTVEYEKLPALVEVFEVYDYDYDNATSLGVVSIDSTKTITASVSRNNDTLEVTSSQIKIPLNTASYVSYKGYNWSENRGSSTCAKVGKVITADDKLYICYETTPVTINIADCYTTSLDYLSNDVVTRISDSVVGGTTKKYYVLDRAGYEFKEVRKGDELGEIVPVLEDENGKYIEVTATDYTNYYFRYLRTANETYKVDYYNVYDWDFDNAEYVETYSKLIAPDGTVSYEGTKLLDDSGNWIDANKEGYIFDGHYSIELETEGEFEKQHTVYYRFFSSDTDKNIDYTIKYQAVWNDGTPAQGIILNEETTGVDGFISTEDNFKVTYEGLRPIYQVQQNNDILEYNFNNQFKWTGMTCADFTDSTKTIELVATNPSINETSTRSLVLEKRNTWTGGTKYNISEFNGDDFSSLFFATSNSTENIELEYSDAGVEHTLVVKVNMGVKPTVKKLKVPVEIIYQKNTTVLPDYTAQDYETVTIENITFPEVEVIVKEHVIGDGYTIISTPTLTFNLEDYDFSAGLQVVANSYGVDISKLSLKEKDCGVGYSAFNTGENDGIYDESEFDNLIKTLVVDDTTKLLDSSVTFSVKEDLAHFGKFTIFLKYTVEPPSVIVHYKDTDGNTLREDNVYIDYTKVYYPVEKIDDYIPTGVVEGSVIYPVVLEQEQQFAEYRGDNTGDKSHTLKLRLGSPMNITSFQDSEITVIYEKEPSYKITVVDEFYNIDGSLVKADERLVEYKKAGENYSYYALNPVPDGYICFSDTSYSGVVTQDTIITFVYKDDYARFVTVKGVVMYKDGTPVANKRIEIHSTPRYTVTDENGYYEVNNVEVGDHKFIIFANDEDDTPLVTCDLSVTKPDEDTVKVTFKSENTDVETDTSVTDILEIDAYLPVYTIKVIDEYYTDGVLDKSEVRCEDSYKAGETYAYSALSPEDYTVSGITEASGVALSNLTITFKYLKTTTKPDEPEPASYRLKVIDNFYNSDYVLQDSSVRVNNEVTEGTPYDYKALDVDDYKVSGTKHYTGVIKEDTTLVFTYIQEVKEPERYTLKVRDIFFDENGVVEKDSVRYEKVVDSGFSYYFKALDTADYKVTSAIEVNGVVTQNTEIIFTYAKKTIPVPEPEAKEYKITVIDKFIIGKDVIEYNPYYFDNLGDEVTVTETEDGYELSIARFVTEDHEVSVQSIVRCIDTYKEGAEYFYSALNLPEAWKVISDTHYSGVVTKDETLVFVYTLNFEDDDDIPEIPDNPEPTIPFEEPVTGIETGKGLEVVIFFGCLIALLVILKKKEK